MRVFIAIDCEDLKDYFLEVQSQIPQDIAKITIVKSFHLTLRFLGETEKIEEIKSALSKVEFKPFKLMLDNIGVFPAESYIKVVWVGFKGNDYLKKLQQDVEDVLEEFHFKRDFEFMPHLTLVRVRFIKKKQEFIERLKEISVEPKEIVVKEFKLIKSTLTSEGPVYEELGLFKAIAL